MSDESMFSGMTRKQRLRAEVAYLMAKGGAIGGAVFFGIWITIAVLHWIGTTILPEESQMAEDPAPQAFIDLANQESGVMAAEDAAASE
jgi:ABC-type nitrate/sulfonate/bicarbonate transport system permease component